MKKILFALIGIVATTLTSCLPDPEFSYSVPYSRVATIDTTGGSVKFIADYTGEVFKNITNLMHPEDLAMFNLEGAQRAEVLIRLDIDESYKQSLLMLDARKIDVRPITNKVPTDTMPLLSLQRYPLGGTVFTPTAWVSNGYLNILPVIPSEDKTAQYFLTPEKAIKDSIYFKLTASYKEDASKTLYENIHCYDLRTLRDTDNADAALSNKMREVLSAMETHRGDSIMIIVTGDFIDYNYKGKDTIRTINHTTNYFKCNFLQ